LKVIAIDPGKDKVGIAVVDDDRKVYLKNIINSKDINCYLVDLLADYNIDILIIGDGTFSDKLKKKIKEEIYLPIYMVDEAYSTVEAENRYRQEKKNWLMRLLKWKPAEPVDDYVAVILAERYFQREM